jgi:cytochrome c-type protein NapC
MDPENQAKVAMMIAGQGIEFVEQAGCWVTCHADSRYMRDAPEADALGAAGDVAGRIDLTHGVTKYLAESRTKVEVAGRRGKKRGGWDQLKGEDELKTLTEAQTYMDLIRYRSGGAGENGRVLDQRSMKDETAITAEGGLAAGTWTVVISRPLVTGKPGDIPIEAGKTYTVGFAVHDDYTSARFHHVSLEYTLALDNGDADINVVKK